MNRLERLKALLAERDFEAVVLCKPANIAAFFQGAQASLGFRQEPPGRIAISVTQDTTVLLGNQTEVTRVAEDELSWVHGLIARPFRWDQWNQEVSVKRYLDSEGITRLCDDIGVFGENVGATMEEMYYPLTNQEIDDLRSLAKDTASIVESLAKNLEPGTTEVRATGELAGQLVSQGIWPEFIMVAADERISRLRHCVPREIAIRRLGLLSATVHRRGLYLSLTRLVSFGTVTSEWRRLQEASNRIDARAIFLSKPGISVGEIFRAMMQGYEEEGYPEEWRAHHQGGPAGFHGRDYKATENESRSLVERQPIVWNPTVCGGKSEDTILTGRSGEMSEILTETGTWAYYDITSDAVTVRRPIILEK